MQRTPIHVDVTPGAHSFLDAIGVVSFKLGCGCTVRPDSLANVTDEDRIVLFKEAGNEYPCRRHGTQVITRATTRLTGWRSTSTFGG